MSEFEFETPQAPKTNQSVSRSCETCGGDLMVVVQTRPAKASTWMREHGLSASGEIDEMAPCPDCNAQAETSYRRADGHLVESPGPDIVREMMRS